MKNYLIIASLVLFACNSQVTTEHHEKESLKPHDHSSATTEVKAGKKWKADEITKENVAALLVTINDSSFSSANRKDLVKQLRSNVDKLVSECKMKGPDHDALHGWLENVLKGMALLKDENVEFQPARSNIQKQVESFYLMFE